MYINPNENMFCELQYSCYNILNCSLILNLEPSIIQRTLKIIYYLFKFDSDFTDLQTINRLVIKRKQKYITDICDHIFYLMVKLHTDHFIESYKFKYYFKFDYSLKMENFIFSKLNKNHKLMAIKSVYEEYYKYKELQNTSNYISKVTIKYLTTFIYLQSGLINNVDNMTLGMNCYNILNNINKPNYIYDYIIRTYFIHKKLISSNELECSHIVLDYEYQSNETVFPFMKKYYEKIYLLHKDDTKIVNYSNTENNNLDSVCDQMTSEENNNLDSVCNQMISIQIISEEINKDNIENKSPLMFKMD